MAIWTRAFELADLTALGAKSLPGHVGIEFTAKGENSLSARMPVDARTHQPFGRLHGGASVVLAETVASVAGAMACADGKVTVGLEINANHLRPVTSGHVHATAIAEALGRTTQVWTIRIVDDADKLVCLSRITLAVIERRAVTEYDAIVLGGGAAGLMAAATAGQRGRRVLVVDHAPHVGAKIIISGGGRCNFTNRDAAADRYISANPHFAKSALGRYTAADFVALVDAYGITWHEKTLGQLFCDGSARQIVDLLLGECEKGSVEIATGHPIRDVGHADTRFTVAFGAGTASAPALVIATGGPSIPKLGATGFAYDLARRYGLKIVEPRPALVPLTLSGEDMLFRDIAGVSTEVVAHAGKAKFREAALFTHRGLSGPAILQVSSYWRPGEAISVDLMPDRAPGWLRDAKRASPRIGMKRALNLPDRLADALAERLGLPGELANIADRKLEGAERRLADWRFSPSGSEGFAKAEVTVGGISTAELSSRTMAAKRVPGLYAIGEAVDVTGWLGGYNFQWAWASGWAAGQAL